MIKEREQHVPAGRSLLCMLDHANSNGGLLPELHAKILQTVPRQDLSRIQNYYLGPDRPTQKEDLDTPQDK